MVSSCCSQRSSRKHKCSQVTWLTILRRKWNISARYTKFSSVTALLASVASFPVTPLISATSISSKFKVPLLSFTSGSLHLSSFSLTCSPLPPIFINVTPIHSPSLRFSGKFLMLSHFADSLSWGSGVLLLPRCSPTIQCFTLVRHLHCNCLLVLLNYHIHYS